MAAKSVAIIMGSQSDWATMKHAAKILDALRIGYEARIVSAHRTPKRLYDFAGSARKNGFKVIIAGAGGAAHLPGMTASLTPLPVFGVPMNTYALDGKDSLLSIMQSDRQGGRHQRCPASCRRAGAVGCQTRQAAGCLARAPDQSRCKAPKRLSMLRLRWTHTPLISVQAGIQGQDNHVQTFWVPAFAGTSGREPMPINTSRMPC